MFRFYLALTAFTRQSAHVVTLAPLALAQAEAAAVNGGAFLVHGCNRDLHAASALPIAVLKD